MAIRKGLCKRKVFVREKAAFEDSKKLFEQRCFGCENERLLRAKRKAFCKQKTLVLRKRTGVLAHTKLPDKEKLFFSAQRHRLRTAPKLTCSNSFQISLATVSLQYNNPFSKNNGLALAVQPPFRTDSKPFHRRFVGKTGFDTCRRKFLQSYFRQSFESSPESRGSQTSGVLPVLFVHAKRINPFPFRELRGFPNLESAH